MERKIHNPWTWQDQWGFVQAQSVSGAERTIYCAGQTSVDDDGNPINEGDMRAQIETALDNLERVLEESGSSLRRRGSHEHLHHGRRRLHRSV